MEISVNLFDCHIFSFFALYTLILPVPQLPETAADDVTN